MAVKKVTKRKDPSLTETKAQENNLSSENTTSAELQTQNTQKSISKMSNTAKAAAVLIALGSDSASEIIKHLHENEIEILSAEIAKIRQLSSDENNAIINEFYQMCITQKAITEGGLDYASTVLNKAFGDKKANELIVRATNKIDSSAFAFIKDADNKNLVMVLRNEHPQTIAVILSHASPDKVSQIISQFPRETQIDIIERISTLERANPDVLAIVEKTLKKRMSSMYKVGTVGNGGTNYIAEIMNRIDKNSQKAMLDSLSETNPELSENIRKLMFVFNDIMNLNDMEIQAFIRVADTKDLTIALKSASKELQNRIFNNMSTRQRDTIQSDMQYLRNLRVRDVEAAQQRIIAVIRELEESGDIVLFKGGDDEIIA
ncbi:MAG: flagellar motor switch protein FliG [Ruminococcus sp.]|jgi:flagellar motor switch protein FliG|nr:flagellar motor switch protein FliG [Ruminococcus sp.]